MGPLLIGEVPRSIFKENIEVPVSGDKDPQVARSRDKHPQVVRSLDKSLYGVAHVASICAKKVGVGMSFAPM